MHPFFPIVSFAVLFRGNCTSVMADKLVLHKTSQKLLEWYYM